VALIAIYVLLPWIPVRGHPAVFLDVVELRFHFFGLTFAAQDLWLGFFVLTGMAFGLFYLTALFGRLWCGWACPQTVFLEHVYRRIERWIEGDAQERRQLDKGAWTQVKVLKRGLKLALFAVVSFAIAHVFLAYFVSLPHLWGMMTSAPGEHWGVFLFVAVLTGLLFVNYTWFREQLCIILCPYGRLQSALIDDDSVTIGYDEIRGEPRGKAHHGPTAMPAPVSAATAGAKVGDCIDCFKCVHVCPTGIDIRQGLQLECIGCANCIDACDEVMTRLGRPRGLVRYDSLNGLAGRARRILRPRIILYSILLVLGASAAVYSASRYRPMSMSAVRMIGAPYFVDDAAVRNQFNVRIINKQSQAETFLLDVAPIAGAPEGLRWTGWEGGMEIAPGAEEVRPLILFVPRGAYAGKFRLRLTVTNAQGGARVEREIEFIGPDPRLLKAHATPVQ
jgi:cytochrome c oxidase accessory protein FixG